MITFRSFSFTYPGMNAPALRDINLRIEPGEAVLVRGASGSGKSTFLYCMNGIIPHIFAGYFHGDISVNGFSPCDVPIRDVARTIGTVFQNPESQIFMMRVDEDVAFGCENLLLPREEIIRRRDEALRCMELWDMRHRETFKLSGGQKQRLAISSIFAMGTEIFLFDEPTTDLDATGRQEFKKIVADLKDKGKTVILAEHQYEEYLPLMDRVITFENGRITENGTTDNFSVPAERSALALGETVVSLQGITFGYQRHESVLNGVDVSIKRGDMVALCGDNGSGKTTLLKITGGLIKPDRGRIRVLNMENPSLDNLAGRIGFLFQNPDEQLFTDSVEEEIAFGASRVGKKAGIDHYLDIANLGTLRYRHPQTISRGQRQILAVAAVMAMEPELLILDEPTTGLDEKSWRKLIRLFHDYISRRGTVIFSTHNVRTASAARRKITIRKGRVVRDEVSG